MSLVIDSFASQLLKIPNSSSFASACLSFKSCICIWNAGWRFAFPGWTEDWALQSQLFVCNKIGHASCVSMSVVLVCPSARSCIDIWNAGWRFAFPGWTEDWALQSQLLEVRL